MQLFRSILGRLIPTTKKSDMKISQEGLCLIKKFEGCSLEAYQCAASVWTYGYGSTKNVQEGDTITKEDAEKLLSEEIKEYENYVKDLVEVDLNQNQFDALVSWVFNLGPDNLKKSTLLKVLNNKKYEDVPAQIQRWNKVDGKVLEGLVRRRNAESLLFEGKEWGKI